MGTNSTKCSLAVKSKKEKDPDTEAWTVIIYTKSSVGSWYKWSEKHHTLYATRKITCMG